MHKISSSTVLLITHDPSLADAISRMFSEQAPHAFEFVHLSSLADARIHLTKYAVDVVLLDFALAGAAGVDVISRIHCTTPKSSIVLLCDEADEHIASEAMLRHVQEYLIKGQIEPHELLRATRHALSRKALQDALFSDMDRAQITLKSIGDAVICTDKNGNISFLNPVAEAMTGWEISEVAGKPLTEAFHIINANTGLIAANPMEDAIGKNAPAKMPPNCILVRRDGHEIYIEDSVAPIHSDDGQDAGAVLVFRDVTVARTLAAQVAHLAEHDALTGLPNRLLFADRLGQAIARAGRNESLIAVLFLDLDGFKRINDSLGHRIGDKLLESVAVRLEQCLRVPDTVSRLGGDEFVIMLLDVHQPEDAAIAARRILNAVADAHPIATHELYITASIGISVFPDDGLDTETLIKNADTAMYQAKESGRQTFKFFRPEMNVVAVERQAIEEALRGALERNEFTLHYQPKFNLKSGIIIGVEALLRWNHSTRGDIPPAQFISIAEDSGLMLSIGTWVLRTACGQAKTWADAGLPHITMAVNVSSIQLHDEEFLYQLTEVLEETGLDPRLLEIEVTESILMDRPELAARMFRVLREWGVRISIDDFGTGYSSLSYLGKLPLDAIKIDQAFVRQIDTNPEHKAIVGAIVSMAQSLKLRVIAEGVETAEELAFLKTRGCDETQGYLFSRALPADQFVSLLTASVS